MKVAIKQHVEHDCCTDLFVHFNMLSNVVKLVKSYK